MFRTTVILAALLACCLAQTSDILGVGCVYNTDGSHTVSTEVPYDPKYHAWGAYNDTLSELGWGKMHVRVRAEKRAENDGAFFCGGVVEGYLSRERIAQYFRYFKNVTLQDYGTSDWPDQLVSWMKRNLQYARTNAAAHGRTDAWWRAVGYILARTDGLRVGYNEIRFPTKDPEIDELNMWLMQATGDLGDIGLFVMSDIEHGEHVKPRSAEWHDSHHHCTALVRLADDLSDVYAGHDSWTNLNDLNRILKDYEFNIADNELSHNRWGFSGYPGLLYSVDDIYVMDKEMVVFETTLNTWNMTLYELYCKPESVLNWVRTQVANMLASNGKAWTQYFGRENSFTYNDQYMVLDYSKFKPGSKPQKGFLWTSEQTPGFYAVGDRTDELNEKGWIPGINTPFFEEIYNASGVPEQVKKTGSEYWSYYGSPRYRIMERDVVKKVKNYEDFKKFLRYNDWKNDELSNGDAGQAILSRYDLRPEECVKVGTMMMCPKAFGGVDSKTVCYKRVQEMTFDAISSPQYETQPAWEFGVGRFKDLPWTGMPKVWKFPWTVFGPEIY